MVVEKFDGESVLPFTRSNTENHFSYNEQQRYSYVLFSLSPPPRLGSFPSEREDHKDARWCQAPFFLRLFYSNILFRRDDKIPPIIIHTHTINASRVFNEEERARKKKRVFGATHNRAGHVFVVVVVVLFVAASRRLKSCHQSEGRRDSPPSEFSSMR